MIPQVHRTPPYSESAEQGVLGSMLISRPTIAECVQKIDEEYFYIPANQTIFCALVELWRADRPIDLITFTQHLRDKNLLEGVGGAAYVTSIFTFVPTAANVLYYLDIMHEKYVLRSIIAAATESVRRSYEEQADVEEVLSKLQDQLVAAAVPFAQDEKFLPELIQEKLERMQSGEPDADIISTGIAQIDRQSPLRRGDMPLISGIRKAGKSILALTIAVNIARKGVPVLYFSLEDRLPKIIDRLMANVSRIPTDRQHVSKLSAEEMEIPIRAAEEISKMPLYLRDDIFDLGIIVATAKQAKQKYHIGLIVIDYAQLIRAEGNKDSNREQRVAEVSRTLRLLAMSMDTPVLLLCQLNEKLATRESRALEQDCTALWRIEPENEDEPNVRDIIIPCQRNGPSGVGFKVTFLGNIARVENYAQDH